MEFLTNLFLNLDVVLQDWVAQYGAWIYALLFVVIFTETGLVVMPFLPGDSLLFAAGALAAVSDGGLNLWILYVVLFSAAVLGDFLNYTIGRHWGRRILDSGRLSWVIKPRHIEATEAFFERHGGKTISLARFFPFIRTFAPFVAGISRMEMYRFVAFSVLGTAAWVGIFVTAGYLFGQHSLRRREPRVPGHRHHRAFRLAGVPALRARRGYPGTGTRAPGTARCSRSTRRGTRTSCRNAGARRGRRGSTAPC